MSVEVLAGADFLSLFVMNLGKKLMIVTANISYIFQTFFMTKVIVERRDKFTCFFVFSYSFNMGLIVHLTFCCSGRGYLFLF